jgi:3-hydroxyisobutyrate dehydrogenase-like beta-hydroxyacid dehydrogenase
MRKLAIMPLCAAVLKTGHSLSVYNRPAAKTLTNAGAWFVPTPAEAAKDGSVVISMLSDDSASREVWLGGGSALEVREGAILIESSTVTPSSRRLV